MFTKNELLDIMCGLSDSNARWMERAEKENDYNRDTIYMIIKKNNELWDKVALLHDRTPHTYKVA
jgi:hypothetical protein